MANPTDGGNPVTHVATSGTSNAPATPVPPTLGYFAGLQRDVWQPGDLGWRFLAAVLDQVFALALGMGFAVVVFGFVVWEPWYGNGVQWRLADTLLLVEYRWLLVVAPLLVYAAAMTAWRGRTPGQVILGLRVVDDGPGAEDTGAPARRAGFTLGRA